MPTQIQWRRGNTAQTAVFTGAVGEVTVDTDKNTLVVHDGTTAGGYALAKESAQQDALAYAHANSAYDKANTVTSAYTHANAAYNAANTKFNSTGGTISGDVLVAGNVTPTTDNDKYLGSASYRWHSLYVGPGSVNIGGISLSNVNNTLTISGASTLSIPGAPDTAKISLHANAAFDAANTAALSTGAYGHANAAYLQANAAYAQANTTTIHAQAAFNAANNATDTWVRNAANSASSYANSAYDQANTATQYAQSAGDYANSAYSQSNTATTNAATADQRAVTSGSYANSAYAKANTVASDLSSANTWLQSYVNTQVSNLIDSAPGTLDTLNELAAALGDDSNFATTITTTIGTAGSYANSAFSKANAATSNTFTGNANGSKSLDVVNVTTTNTEYTGLSWSSSIPYPNDIYITNINQATADWANSLNVGDVFTIVNSDGETKTVTFASMNPSTAVAGQALDIYPSGTLSMASYPSGSNPSITVSRSSSRTVNYVFGTELTSNGATISVAAGSYANSAYSKANTGTILAQAAFDAANNSVDTWVRSAANSASSYANSAFDKANTSLQTNATGSTIGTIYAASLRSNTLVTINTLSTLAATSNVSSSNSQITVDSFSVVDYRTVKYLAQITSGADLHATELLLIHDDSTVYMTQSNEIMTANSLGSFDATITTAILSLLFTPENAETTIDLVKTSLVARSMGLQGDLMSQSGTVDLQSSSGTEDLGS